MTDALRTLKTELERFGKANDGATAVRAERMLNITRDTGELLSVLVRAKAEAFDLVFLDSERSEYPGWWPRIDALLRPGGLLVADNATSHAAQMAPFVALIDADPRFTTCLVPVGNGEYLVVKAW